MSGHYFNPMRLTFCVVGVSAYAIVERCPAAQPDKETLLQVQERMGKMRGKGTKASLTIFPVILWDTKEPKRVGEMGKNVANVVGLLLEKAGMDNLETTDDAFLLPAGKRSSEDAIYLANLIRKRGLCKIRVEPTPLSIQLTRTSNEAKMLWDMARAFREQVRKNPFDTAYALYAWYGLDPRGKGGLGSALRGLQPRGRMGNRRLPE